jgi:glycosyltransferase involved in cell wall biosynthesis
MDSDEQARFTALHLEAVERKGCQPTISVLMPAYNVASYVVPAIESVLAQTFRDFELVVVDDGSTDGTLERASRFQCDSRVRVIAETHRGMPYPICRGVELTQAPYIALLDGDDLWAPTKLERHSDFFESHPNADLTFSWSRIVDEHGHYTGLTSRAWRGSISFRELLMDNVISNGSSLVVRRDALLAAGGIDASLPVCYDIDTWLRVALLRPENVHAIPEFLTFYRRRPGQLTCNVPLMETNFERVLERLRAIAPQQVASVEEKARCNMQRFFAYGSYQNGDFASALRFLRRSLVAAPVGFLADIRNWKMTAAALAGMALPRRWHSLLVQTLLRSGRA